MESNKNIKDGLMRRILIRKTNQWESNIWQTWKKEKKIMEVILP